MLASPIVLVSALVASLLAAPVDKVTPRDDAATDPGLAEVRRQIRRAVAARDPSLLLPVLGPEVVVELEKTVPRAEVPAAIASMPADARLAFWRDLHDAMRVGVAIDANGEYAYAPHLVVTLHSDETALVITGRGVRIRAAPSPDAPVIAVLSYDVVQRDPRGSALRAIDLDGYRYEWLRILMPSGASGFVASKYAREAAGQTFVFKRIEGRWKLIRFVVDV